MVITSPKGHFVDIRILKNCYPWSRKTPAPAFDEVFEWCLSGIEEPIEGTNKIRFNHDVNSQEIIKSIKTGRPLDECRSAPDVGAFSAIDGSEDRKETGSMVNPATNKETEYVEIWRSLDAEKTTKDLEVREPKHSQRPQTFVLEASLATYEGKVVRYGNWVQGLLHDKEHSTSPLSVVRSHCTDGKWEHYIQYGSGTFPVQFSGQKGEHVVVNGVEWRCIESS